MLRTELQVSPLPPGCRLTSIFDASHSIVIITFRRDQSDLVLYSLVIRDQCLVRICKNMF